MPSATGGRDKRDAAQERGMPRRRVLAWLASVGLFGDRVHVVTRDPTGTERQPRELVAAAGFELVSIRSVEPSLEDVFVSVLAEQKPAVSTTATALSNDT